jgi:hypothetical protein
VAPTLDLGQNCRGGRLEAIEMMPVRSLILAAAAAAALAAPAAAQNVFPDIAILANRVPLGCAIEIEKVFVVTNTTANPIAAGTPIFIDILRFPTGAHDVLNYHGAELPVGGVFREGTYQATSCTAWIEVPPLTLAPSVATPPIGPAAPLTAPLLRAP